MTDTNVELALLAMDAYDQGYNQGLLGLSNQIGDATIIKQSDVTVGTNGVNAGFYAVAYQFANGNVVISYRGTDAPTGRAIEDGNVGNDITTGYGLGLGFSEGPQAKLAVDFYQQVRALPGVANVVVTGHSLGGGLAGYVGALYGLEGRLFDNMAFESAASEAYTISKSAFDGGLASQYLFPSYGEALAHIYKNYEPVVPNIGLLRSIVMEGQFLTANLVGQQTPIDILPKFAPDFNNPFKLHSQALLVCLSWAQQSQYSAWHSAGSQLLSAMFNDQLAQDAGAGTLGGSDSDKSQFSSALKTAIAYTAIDSGTITKFGTTALTSMFTDADMLGTLVTSGSLNGAMAGDPFKSALAEVAVQFAGDQAVAGNQDTSFEIGALDTISGGGSTLTINFDPKVWKSTTTAGGKIVGRDDLILSVVGNASSPNGNMPDLSVLGGGVNITDPTQYKKTDSGNRLLSLSSQIGLFQASLGAGAALDSTKAAAGFGSMLVGGAGSPNTLIANDLNNILVGGGTDTFDVGNGQNIIMAKGGDVETIDFARTDTGSYPFGSNLCDIVGKNATIKLEHADQSNCTILWGGGGNTTYDFLADESKSIHVTVLEMTGVTQENFLNLDVAALHLSGIVIVNPTGDDILEYNDNVLLSPKVLQNTTVQTETGGNTQGFPGSLIGNGDYNFINSWQSTTTVVSDYWKDGSRFVTGNGSSIQEKTQEQRDGGGGFSLSGDLSLKPFGIQLLPLSYLSGTEVNWIEVGGASFSKSDTYHASFDPFGRNSDGIGFNPPPALDIADYEYTLTAPVINPPPVSNPTLTDQTDDPWLPAGPQPLIATAASVSSRIDQINTDKSVSSISLSDTGVPTLDITALQYMSDTSALAKITNINYVVNVTDTAAKVADNLDVLATKIRLGAIHLKDTTTPVLTLTVAQLTADAPVLAKIVSPYTLGISDSAAHVVANLDILNSNARLSSIVFTGSGTPLLSLTLIQALNDGFALSKIAKGSATIVATGLAASLQALTSSQLATLVTNGVTSLTSTDGPVVLSVAQALAFESANIGLAAPSGTANSLIDTAAHLSAMTAAQIAGLASIGIGVLTSSAGNVTYSVAQTAAILAANISIGAPANASVTENFADGSKSVLLFGATGPLSRITHTNADKTSDIRYYTSGTFQGTAYASYDNAYTAANFRNLETFYDAAGNVVASESFQANGGYSITVGGALKSQKSVNSDTSYSLRTYTSGTFSGVAYASYDNAYTIANFRNLETFYDAAGNVVATEAFSSNGGYAITVGGVLKSQKSVNADTSYDLRTYTSGTFSGAAYASYDNAYTIANFRNLETFYDAAGNVVASETFQPNGSYAITVGGVLSSQKSVNADTSYDLRTYAGGIFQGTAYASYDNAYSIGGFRNLQTFYNSAGSVVASEIFLANGGYTIKAGGALFQQKTVNADLSYDVHYYTGGTFSGATYASYDNSYTASGFRNLEIFYNAAGTVVATETFLANGGYAISVGGLLTQQKSINSDTSYFVNNTHIQGQTYTSYEDNYNAAHARIGQTRDNTDGSGSAYAYANDLQFSISSGHGTLSNDADSFDFSAHANQSLILTGYSHENLSFGLGFGRDQITGYVGIGAGADQISFDHTLFADWAHLLAGTRQVGADTLITVDANDTITLKNTLVGNLQQANFHFT